MAGQMIITTTGIGLLYLHPKSYEYFVTADYCMKDDNFFLKTKINS